MNKKYRTSVIVTLFVAFFIKDLITVGLFRNGINRIMLSGFFLTGLMDFILLTVLPSILLTIALFVRNKTASIVLSSVSIFTSIPIMIFNGIIYYLSTIEASDFEWWIFLINVIPLVFSIVTIVLRLKDSRRVVAV